jgi:EmrB/QacA subfamily drug resistance transporter
MPDATGGPQHSGSLSHREILGVLSGILLGMLLAALDQTVVTTALPAMATDLHGLQHLSWIVTAYLLTTTAATPIYGKLSDLYGRRLMLQIAIAVFVLASAACALAQDMGQLIAARAVQGIGGGGLISMAHATMADIVSARERGRYQGYLSGVWGVASVAGPLVGGLSVEYLSWRWAFWINIPIGIVGFVLCTRALRRLTVRRRPQRIDFLGAGLMMPAVTALLLVAAWGGTEMPWNSLPIIGLSVVGLLLLAAFGLQELRAPDALIPPRLFINKVIRVSIAINFLIAITLFATIMLLPVFLQLVVGVSAGDSGILLIPLIGAQVVGSFATGQLMRTTGHYKRYPLLGFAGITLSFVLLSTMDAGTPELLAAAYMALNGVASGMSMPPLMVAAQNAAELRDLGVATAAVGFFRSLGGSFGAAILWSVLLFTLGQHLVAAGAGDPALGTGLLRGGVAGIAQMSAASRAMLLPALAHSFSFVFRILAVVGAAGFVATAFLQEVPLRTTAGQIAARNLDLG